MSVFLVWLAGAAVAIIPQSKIFTRSKLWRNLGLIISATALVAFLSISRAKRMGLGFNIMAVLTAIAMAALIYFILYLRTNKNPSGKSLYTLISKKLAGCSYSLYLVHSPVIFFFSILIYTQTGLKWLPETGTIILSSLIILAILCYALFIAHYTEANTDKVRRWIENRLFKNPRKIVVNKLEIGEMESKKI
jgi:peptidoglycan/LPS O-acetylase OafA/YrhL